MTVPALPTHVPYSIASVVSYPQMVEATLTDGTVLWIPTDSRNNDYAALVEWAALNHITL